MTRIEDMKQWLTGLKKSRDFDALYEYADLLACELIVSDKVARRLDEVLRETVGEGKALEINAEAARRACEEQDEFALAEQAFYAEV